MENCMGRSKQRENNWLINLQSINKIYTTNKLTFSLHRFWLLFLRRSWTDAKDIGICGCVISTARGVLICWQVSLMLVGELKPTMVLVRSSWGLNVPQSWIHLFWLPKMPNPGETKFDGLQTFRDIKEKFNVWMRHSSVVPMGRPKRASWVSRIGIPNIIFWTADQITGILYVPILLTSVATPIIEYHLL